MEKYDINKDGFFSMEEMTFELEELENNLINDSGFGILVFFGYPFCLLYTLIICLISSVLLILYIYKGFKKVKTLT